MLNAFRNKRTNVLAWLLMAMLVVGLAGFGIGVGGGLTSRDVAQVGDESITSEAYTRALDQELRAISGQIGRALPMEEARQFGIDRTVLARLAGDAALDGEADRLGLSSGDETVGAQVMATSAFQGIDGKFDRAAYAFALERTGLSPAAFEELVRREATRELLGSGVQAPADLPDSAARTVLDYVGERRGFDWLRLDASLLPEPVPAPTEEELRAEYDANPGRYTRPETRRITYASVTPEALAATIEYSEEDLRAAYDSDPQRFTEPERRVVDRIGFRSAEDAAAARTRIDAGEIGFDAVATERGLTPEEMDRGAVTAADLEGESRDAVFGADGPGIVGPVETPLGPSLFRINAVMAAKTTSFEEAKAEIARERALEEAGARITEETPAIEDLIAGGATIEEIASETLMDLGTIELTEASTGGLADDAAFRQLAAAAGEGEETDVVELAGGGLATLRVEAVEPPAPIPFEEVRTQVAEDWTAARTAEALAALATGYAVELDGGLEFAALAERLGIRPQAAAPLTRGQSVPDLPRALIAEIFAAKPNGTVILPDADRVVLARVGAVEAFEPGDEANAALLDNLREQFRSQATDDVLALYTAALRDAAGVRVNQELIESTLARFP